MLSECKISKQLIIGICVGAAVAFFSQYVCKKLTKAQSALKQNHKHKKRKQLVDLIGHTPLVYLARLSHALKCQVYVKVEYLNPFGSSKDRAVKHMLDKLIDKARSCNQKVQQVVQASSGSTAISLVQLCKIYNIKATLFLPDDLAQDKYAYLQILGANIIKVPQVSIVDPNHFFNKARDYAKHRNAVFLNQFDNLDNMEVHEQETASQIYEAMNQNIDAFVCSAGTGGTLAGVSKYLKQVTHGRARVVLADPEGSGLHAKVKYGTLFTIQQKQGHRLKNPFDTVIEGVGLNRPTANFQKATIDTSYKIKDMEALHMANYLIQNQGLFIGGSSALNLCAVVKYCRANPNSRIVTILHDSGNRYLRKFYSKSYLEERNIKFVKRHHYPPQNLNFIQ